MGRDGRRTLELPHWCVPVGFRLNSGTIDFAIASRCDVATRFVLVTRFVLASKSTVSLKCRSVWVLCAAMSQPLATPTLRYPSI
eukprot:COSAG06_NODE_7846_length_2354_cov_65.049224_1_plen_83_part_10